MIVHILHHGFALCRFSHELPGDWPVGHKWIGKDEANLATCPGCLVALRPLAMWVIYDHPADQPDHFVARRWFCTAPEPTATNEVFLGATLDEVRRALPLGLVCMQRMPGDDSKVVEVWL